MRSYFLPVGTSCWPSCRFCELVGCQNSTDRSADDVDRALHRAASGQFARVIFPAQILASKLARNAFERCKQYGMAVTLRADYHCVDQVVALLEARGNQEYFGIEILCAGDEEITPEFHQRLSLSFSDVKYRLVPRRGSQVVNFLQLMPEKARQRVEFHFPHFSRDNGCLSTVEVFRSLQEVVRKLPALKISTPPGLEVWDSRIPHDLCLEPHLTPSIAYEIGGAQPVISVIVPSYNSGPLLRNVLKHLLDQNLDRNLFEVIVVDDGSNDDTQTTVRNLIAPEACLVNFKYVYFPRARSRQRGDGHFRAGIARNLGVKLARGRILSFLDSDIITPPDFLSDLIARHDTWDVIQNVRLHLKDKKSNEFIAYQKIDVLSDTYIEEKNYWTPFFSTKNWEGMTCYWKYTCSYSLSVKTTHFKGVGWFRRTFNHYGFEDTDLGYRLAKCGHRFHLNPTPTYHLYPDAEQTEHRKSHWRRQILLAKTAKIFYLNNLDPEIFTHLNSYMHGELSWFDSWRLSLRRDVANRTRETSGLGSESVSAGVDAGVGAKKNDATLEF